MTSKQAVLTLYKNHGETPLECLERFKKDNPEYLNDKMTYAGRLDPLAEGLLLILVGEECKNKEKYLGFDKEYEVDVLFGFSTDTYDILGKVTKSFTDFVIPAKAGIQADSINLDSRLRGNDTINELLNSFVGRFSQKYPAYSSKFFNKARRGELKDEEISEKVVEIKSIQIVGEKTIPKIDLKKYIEESITLVKGNFRQEEILKNWKFAMANFQPEEYNFSVFSLRVSCTSGTYMRSLANSIGKKAGIPALALNIKRTRVGKYKI